MDLLLPAASLSQGCRQWISYYTPPHCLGAVRRWNSYYSLPHCLVAVGSGSLAACHLTASASGQWAVDLLRHTALLPSGSEQWYSSTTPAKQCCIVSGQWYSRKTQPHCLGAAGSGSPIGHCLTACGQWAVNLLWHTTSLPVARVHAYRWCIPSPHLPPSLYVRRAPTADSESSTTQQVLRCDASCLTQSSKVKASPSWEVDIPNVVTVAYSPGTLSYAIAIVMLGGVVPALVATMAPRIVASGVMEPYSRFRPGLQVHGNCHWGPMGTERRVPPKVLPQVSLEHRA